MAEGVFRNCLEQHPDRLEVEIDSAGTHSYHVGSPPDDRARKAAAHRGVDISGLQARRVAESDFERFDYILAMDQDNLEELLESAAEEFHSKIQLFLDFSSVSPGAEVPDPYYGNANGFERVLDLVEEGARGLISELQQISAGKKRSR